MCVAFTTNYFFSGRRRPIDSETLLVTDFMNLKIKPTQSFRGTHRNRVYVYVHMNECLYVYEYLCLYCVFFKRIISYMLSLTTLFPLYILLYSSIWMQIIMQY
jgi:hypothetical protein